jgi:hypothetical protein
LEFAKTYRIAGRFISACAKLEIILFSDLCKFILILFKLKIQAGRFGFQHLVGLIGRMLRRENWQIPKLNDEPKRPVRIFNFYFGPVFLRRVESNPVRTSWRIKRSNSKNSPASRLLLRELFRLIPPKLYFQTFSSAFPLSSLNVF